ncbi:MAG: hypothetical protein KBG39_09750 [Opitutaceae bacterium]|nr:hypothetical protein [Opitutaceae bacterium]
MSLHNTTSLGCFLSCIAWGTVLYILSCINWVVVGLWVLSIVVGGIIIIIIKDRQAASSNDRINPIKPTPRSCGTPITKSLIRNVKQQMDRGVKIKDIANETHISTSAVYKIRRGDFDDDKLPE